jgi:hypothetical protein
MLMYPLSEFLRIQSERDGHFHVGGFSRSERGTLTFLRFDVCALSSIFVFLTLPAMGQEPQSQPPAAPPIQNPAAQTPAPQPTGPDYPDPRTFTLGIFYWATGPGQQTSYYGGSQATDYETLTNWGRAKRTPGLEASFPISRTGELRAEYFRTQGDGNQIASKQLDIFGSGYAPGTLLSTQYKIQSVKFYLDDLLYPHKFPVAKFRLKALYEVEYVQVKGVIDAPALEAALMALSESASANSSKQIILPVFGIAAEYALSPHLLFRADASGFGLPHKSVLWDAEATIAYRRGAWELRGGGKAFHAKTSPNSTEYSSTTLAGAFVGLRYHWSF